MAQARSATPDDAARGARPLRAELRVSVIAPSDLAATAAAALAARGIEATIVDPRVDAEPDPHVAGAQPFGDGVVAWALAQPPLAADALRLGAICARAAEARRPVCVLAPIARGGRAAIASPPDGGHAAPEAVRRSIEGAAALAYLRSHGAAVSHDVDAWLETIVLLVRYGLPAGPRAAVVAPAGSWLEAQALAVVAEAEQHGTRAPAITARPTDHDATDVVLYHPGLGPVPANLPGLHVAVAPRGELAADVTALYGARAALGAVDVLGRAGERIAIGLGPAAAAAAAELAIDHERMQRQLAKLAPGHVGDHETKVLLAAYGVPITRQAVATTPSAAVKTARRAGFPVELKPWGHDVPSERAGCPVERNLTSDALVRKAYTAVLAAAGRPLTDTGAVIVRETPPTGRELAITAVRLPALGWTIVLDVPGTPQVAAGAPLRLVDAKALAAHVAASRAGDPEPDHAGLANLIRRLSHLVVDLDPKLTRVELPRVVVGGRGARTVVVDASAELA
jgi:hypothetical protein